MSLFASYPYDAQLRFDQFEVSSPDFCTELSITRIQPVLQSKRVVAALYKTGLAIANGNKFHRNLVFLNIEEKLAGLLAF